MNHGLTSTQIEILRQVFLPYAAQIERVDIFGSRATGKYRANSDLDLVLYGQFDESLIDRLRTLFQDSPLAFSVDLQHYEGIRYTPLREHIDRVHQPLFLQKDFADVSSNAK